MSEHATIAPSRRVPNGLAGADVIAWRIYEILRTEALGPENAITVETLSCRIFPDNPSDTDRRVRNACGRLIQHWHVPVASCIKGKFFATKDKELLAFRDNLKSRIGGTQRTIDAINFLLRTWEFESNGMYPATSPGRSDLEIYPPEPAEDQPGPFGDQEKNRPRLGREF